MSWNYRILRARDHYYIGEVYYNRHDEPTSYSGPTGITAETYDDLIAELSHLSDATRYPVLRIRGSELIEVEVDDVE